MSDLLLQVWGSRIVGVKDNTCFWFCAIISTERLVGLVWCRPWGMIRQELRQIWQLRKLRIWKNQQGNQRVRPLEQASRGCNRLAIYRHFWSFYHFPLVLYNNIKCWCQLHKPLFWWEKMRPFTMLAGSEIFSLEMSKTEALTQAGSLAAMLEGAPFQILFEEGRLRIRICSFWIWI